MQSFETARLSMRLLRDGDQTLYCKCYNDPLLMTHIGEPLGTKAAVRSFSAAQIMNSTLPIRRRTWVMQVKKTQVDIGFLALVFRQTEAYPARADIGAIILSEFQNHGFAAEAIRRLVDVAFSNTTAEVLSTQHASCNAAANGLMEKLGFQIEKSLPENRLVRDWILHRSDWQKNQNPASTL